MHVTCIICIFVLLSCCVLRLSYTTAKTCKYCFCIASSLHTRHIDISPILQQLVACCMLPATEQVTSCCQVHVSGVLCCAADIGSPVFQMVRGCQASAFRLEQHPSKDALSPPATGRAAVLDLQGVGGVGLEFPTHITHYSVVLVVVNSEVLLMVD